MYTCSSQTLVHLSGAFGGPPCFCSLPHFVFYTFTQVVLSVDFFFFSSLHWLIWTPDVCLFSLSLSWWLVHSVLSLWARGSRRFVTAPLSSLTFFFSSLCCGGHSLWSLVPFFLEAALYLFSIQRTQQRDCLLDPPNWSWTHLPIGYLLFALWSHGKGILHLFHSVALLSLSDAVNGSEG